MSEFTIEDLGEGRFALSGEMTFETAEKILKASEGPFEEHTQIEVDLSDVTMSDSAGPRARATCTSEVSSRTVRAACGSALAHCT